MRKLPVARSTDIVVQTLGKEVLIYDLNIHKAYNLNETSAIVYQSCDGKTSFEELKIKTDLTDEIIFLALDELTKENLLEKSGEYSSPFNGMSRREAIRKVGLASMIALPVIASLIAPTAAAQSSGACGSGGAACTGANFTQGTCCAGSYCFNGGCIFCFPAGRTCGIGSVCCSGVCTGDGMNPGVCL